MPFLNPNPDIGTNTIYITLYSLNFTHLYYLCTQNFT